MIQDTNLRADEPDPQVQTLLNVLEQEDLPPVHALTPDRARRQFAQLFEETESEPVREREDVEIQGPGGALPLRLYTPDADGPLPVLVFFHGGGFVLGDLDTHDNVCSALANRSDHLVVSVDYRRAPEHPFPAALKDAYAAVEWVDEHGDAVGGDPDRIVVGGDSAGGNLAAAVSLLARDRDGPGIDHQLLVYPAVNAGEIEPKESYVENAEDYFLELDGMEWFRDQYLDDEIHLRNEYRTPLLARDLSELPSATVVTAGFDPLRDEGIEYADRLADAGVDVEHHHYEAMIHGFVSMTGITSQAEDALDRLADRIEGDGRTARPEEDD